MTLSKVLNHTLWNVFGNNHSIVMGDYLKCNECGDGH